ncbi:PAS domain S-box-containing protein/diguanylate cyclase (GGDEF)-like protein [Nitrosospira sp. Nsp5]|uniref:PAS domain S-box-containing protein/diguanylate cyclase (GGDEF) domain-containing protein n=1 Tax=Nitrosospira multiformis TaxID=1231 RepID=A0ABY0TMI9_9PROT|nr:MULTISPECIES: EAL domain-containing protein [Nitrosospira]PTR05245.1 PAS domain S-box-containing protein/diguanylate cyclase (GGDEF)-like protein [Nitrosospira sp. Nsp5]SDQ84215.1 PAS domain S-box-containing protein/diguanylate cyclase (GGDEF) domain-containing protein [Nitrosospira multiformis]
MKISFFIKFFTTILMLLLLAIGTMVYQAFGIQNDIAISEHHRYRSLLLASELFQSSEDLTRMARTYVTTGNPVYKHHFFEILDIREGIKPRPQNYSATYWHLMDAEKDSVTGQGKAVSLLEMMDNEGFSEQEIALMREAKVNSDKLARLEKQAIAALSGLYDDGHGNFTIHHAPDRKFAIDLLFGEQYIAGKAAIMAPIQQFTELLDIRTRARVNDELARLHRQILLVMVFIVIALSALAVTIFYMRRTMLRPLVQLRGQAIQLTQGNYAARCDINTKNELAELSNTLNSMASAIERDVTARKLTEESMRQASMVFENSSEAMMVTNADNIIISVNPAFTSVTGYTPDEVLGKNPGILDSGLHDQFFFQAIRTSLEATGHWEGEITGRRKNTEIYSEWRKVNAIYDEEGSVHRWITLFSDITLKKKSDELIWEQANFDSLTSLPNRYMFHNRLEQEIKKASRAGSSIALILLDLDHFKEVNDTYGHNIGDLLLKEAAWRLSSCVRGIDIVARLGGDEFTVILGGLNNTISINRVVRDILHTMAEPFRLGNEVAYVSASIGVTFYPQDAGDIEALVRNGDQAMYAAKNQGRNCASYFTRTLHEAAQTRMRLASDLRGALAGGQFQLHYQPILELATGSVHKAEALLRWHHPKLGLVNPADFISIAEETRMIVDIGDWVFRTAVQQAKDWRMSHCAEFQISINTSPVQYRKDVDLHETWLEYLQELELPGQSVVIEITEGLLMDASPAVTSKLLAFRNAGLQISMDDFGTGYSSLGYLKRFDIDYLKIDQSFVQSLAPESNDLALCEAIIVMAHKLGIKVIAEGIETEAQRDLLALSGCDYGQGNLFSKPVPADEFENLIKR